MTTAASLPFQTSVETTTRGHTSLPSTTSMYNPPTKNNKTGIIEDHPWQLGGQKHHPNLRVRLRSALLLQNRREHDRARLPGGRLRKRGPVAVDQGVEGRCRAEVVLEMHAGLLEGHLRAEEDFDEN